MKTLRILILVLSISTVCAGQSARDIAQTAFRSVVLLQLDDSHGQPLSLGSGFFIANGIIATNAHVIEGASSGKANLVGSGREMRIIGTLAVDHHSDLALLKVDSSAPPLQLGSDVNLAVGDKVYVVGNPLGLEGTFSEGIVSGIRSIGSDSILQMTAPISPGSSGGPVMDASGKVIGIAQATFKDGQNLNLAVPVSALTKLLAVASQHLQVTSLAQQLPSGTSGGSVVDGLGTRIDAGVVTSDFKLTYTDYWSSTAGFELRISNELPEAISDIRLRIIYRDTGNAIMDFEDFTYAQSIPPGLTKTVTAEGSEEAARALHYYDAHGSDGSALPPPTSDNNYNAFVEKMKPRIEVRVVTFRTEPSE